MAQKSFKPDEQTVIEHATQLQQSLISVQNQIENHQSRQTKWDIQVIPECIPNVIQKSVLSCNKSPAVRLFLLGQYYSIFTQ